MQLLLRDVFEVDDGDVYLCRLGSSRNARHVKNPFGRHRRLARARHSARVLDVPDRGLEGVPRREEAADLVGVVRFILVSPYFEQLDVSVEQHVSLVLLHGRKLDEIEQGTLEKLGLRQPLGLTREALREHHQALERFEERRDVEHRIVLHAVHQFLDAVTKRRLGLELVMSIQDLHDLEHGIALGREVNLLELMKERRRSLAVALEVACEHDEPRRLNRRVIELVTRADFRRAKQVIDWQLETRVKQRKDLLNTSLVVACAAVRAAAEEKIAGQRTKRRPAGIGRWLVQAPLAGETIVDVHCTYDPASLGLLDGVEARPLVIARSKTCCNVRHLGSQVCNEGVPDSVVGSVGSQQTGVLSNAGASRHTGPLVVSVVAIRHVAMEGVVAEASCMRGSGPHAGRNRLNERRLAAELPVREGVTVDVFERRVHGDAEEMSLDQEAKVASCASLGHEHVGEHVRIECVEVDKDNVAARCIPAGEVLAVQDERIDELLSPRHVVDRLVDARLDASELGTFTLELEWGQFVRTIQLGDESTDVVLRGRGGQPGPCGRPVESALLRRRELDDFHVGSSRG